MNRQHANATELGCTLYRRKDTTKCDRFHSKNLVCIRQYYYCELNHCSIRENKPARIESSEDAREGSHDCLALLPIIANIETKVTNKQRTSSVLILSFFLIRNHEFSRIHILFYPTPPRSTARTTQFSAVRTSSPPPAERRSRRITPIGDMSQLHHQETPQLRRQKLLRCLRRQAQPPQHGGGNSSQKEHTSRVVLRNGRL